MIVVQAHKVKRQLGINGISWTTCDYVGCWGGYDAGTFCCSHYGTTVGRFLEDGNRALGEW